MTSSAIEDGLRIAVLLPCRNGAATIGAAVRGFAEALPGARIYVFDNNSTDDTARAASLAGARVFRESRPGKGHVVRRMFADIEADIYVMADGDGAYDPADAPSLVNALVTEHVDMVVGTRHGTSCSGLTGKRLRHGVVGRLYRRFCGGNLSDMFSGYRALSRRFVKSFPAVPTGFGIETELSVHASQLMIPVAEIDLNHVRRPEGAAGKRQNSPSALGALRMSAAILRETRPFLFYSAFAMLFWLLGLALTLPAVVIAVETGRPPPLPTALVATGLFMVGFMSAACGLVLESLGRSRLEQKRILFLAVPALGLR